ncbi:hypothetical protein M4D55_24150 [Metabacillus idriensis]|uniref:Uncharacterized protein n=1 Tax=Metabacillus idriensis TaxID=324768 RepID=A0A6I2MI14_9BACI|nr:hypothetical protein [Metabacillus idriensis]MCM3598834.1 hypothetical protein [Metabacillus idriensis]MRX56767.1 hypothetical protein [Metabacillus idriensis]OHR63460.1 hypothetical protein HMPREF3291_03545 [Bacillus sp. HMSC76G11]
MSKGFIFNDKEAQEMELLVEQELSIISNILIDENLTFVQKRSLLEKRELLSNLYKIISGKFDQHFNKYIK